MLSKIKNNEAYGILSLCERRDSIVMYTHYADIFKGICIGFDWKKFDLNFAGSHPSVKNFPRQVSYSHTPPEIDGRPEEWLKVFITKSEEFSWEKEWRMFYSKGKLRGWHIRQAIREIIFGHNTPKEVIRQAVAWIGDLKNVDLFITEPVIGRFELAIVPY